MKKRKFPNDVARFFNPQKSGTNAEYNKFGFLVKPGTKPSQKDGGKKLYSSVQCWRDGKKK